MIESVAATDETDGEPFLLLSGFEGLGANCNSGRYSCGLLIVHNGLIPGVIEYCTFCTGSGLHMSTAIARPNPKPETRNQKPETRNQKPETRNQKPETRNQKPETRNQKPETRNQKPE